MLFKRLIDLRVFGILNFLAYLGLTQVLREMLRNTLISGKRSR